MATTQLKSMQFSWPLEKSLTSTTRADVEPLHPYNSLCKLISNYDRKSTPNQKQTNVQDNIQTLVEFDNIATKISSTRNQLFDEDEIQAPDPLYQSSDNLITHLEKISQACSIENADATEPIYDLDGLLSNEDIEDSETDLNPIDAKNAEDGCNSWSWTPELEPESSTAIREVNIETATYQSTTEEIPKQTFARFVGLPMHENSKLSKQTMNGHPDNSSCAQQTPIPTHKDNVTSIITLSTIDISTCNHINRQFVDNNRDGNSEEHSHPSKQSELTSATNNEVQNSSGNQGVTTSIADLLDFPTQEIAAVPYNLVSRLEPNGPLPEQKQSPATTSDDEEEFIVNEIIDSRFHYGLLQYQVSWEGHPPDEKWYPAENFTNPIDSVAAFYQQHPQKPGSRAERLSLEKKINKNHKSVNDRTGRNTIIIPEDNSSSSDEPDDGHYADSDEESTSPPAKRLRRVNATSVRSQKSCRTQEMRISLDDTVGSLHHRTDAAISDLIDQSDEIPISGTMSFQIFGSDIGYCLKFSQESIRTILEVEQRRETTDISSRRSGSSPLPERGVIESSRSKRSKFPVDDQLLRRLKEKEGLSWAEIAEHFPNNTQGSLQVYYSKNIKRRQELHKQVRKRPRDKLGPRCKAKGL